MAARRPCRWTPWPFPRCAGARHGATYSRSRWEALRKPFTTPRRVRFEGRFTLPAAGRLPRMAYASCNGLSDPQLAHDVSALDALWHVLVGRHEQTLAPDPDPAAPYHLLLLGGDQIYADPLFQKRALPRMAKSVQRRQVQSLLYRPHARRGGALLPRPLRRGLRHAHDGAGHGFHSHHRHVGRPRHLRRLGLLRRRTPELPGLPGHLSHRPALFPVVPAPPRRGRAARSQRVPARRAHQLFLRLRLRRPRAGDTRPAFRAHTRPGDETRKLGSSATLDGAAPRLAQAPFLHVQHSLGVRRRVCAGKDPQRHPLPPRSRGRSA